MMETLALYAAKTGVCLAVYYLFFKLLLSRETLHRFNRMLLLATILLSFVLPWCVITVYREVPAPPALPAQLLSLLSEAPDALSPAAEPFRWGRLLGGLYLAGVVATLLATGFSVLRVLHLVRRGRREQLPGGWTLVQLPQQVTPFSWWRYIVVSEADVAAEGFREIVSHETAHLRLHHSWDLLATDIAGCLQWFNPAMWLLRSELRAIHEYEADEAVLDSGIDARQYQIMLIKKAAGRRWYSVANSFNHSKLKNRITMMLQKKSSRWAGAKALVVVPLTCVALGAFARTVNVPVEDKSTQNSRSTEIFAAKSDKPVTIRVRVLDDAGEPLAGVIMQEHGTKRGKVTDSSGEASLTIDESASVELLMPGYEAVNLTYRDGTTSMTGRGRMQTTATSADAASRSVTMYPEASAVASVKIRKAGSTDVLATVSDPARQPLFLVEGEVVEEIDSIDPQTIASVNVLKEGESTQPYVEKYGDKAKNGVVLVSLKEVADGSPRKFSEIVVKAGTVDREAPKVSPLYVVDGKVVESIDSIDPQTIASIDVLKGGELTQPYVEKYGEKARNGVVLIHLKSEAEQQRLQESLSYLESDEWKAAKERFHAQQEQFKARQEQFNKQQEQFNARQEQFNKQQEQFNALQESQLKAIDGYFQSDAWKSAQTQLQEQRSYFESDEWKAAQERLRQIGSQQ